MADNYPPRQPTEEKSQVVAANTANGSEAQAAMMVENSPARQPEMHEKVIPPETAVPPETHQPAAACKSLFY